MLQSGGTFPVLILILSAVLAAHQPAPSKVTPELVTRMIDSYGAKRTVAELVGQDSPTKTDFGNFDVVLDGISSGDARWLALVPRVEPGTDAGTAESLRIAVAEALPRNASGVLRLISRAPSWRNACNYPMIEPTDEEARRYFKAAIPAVERVPDPALQVAKKACLTELKRARRAP
jgi:hypothetical protein